MISIKLNGTERMIKEGWILAYLLEELGFARARIAVELNEEVVPASRHADIVLAEGDCIEIVHAIGGG